jgi:hypothetical protein
LHGQNWKFRNAGEEASPVSQLRGEIIPDEGRHAHTEITAYKGTHYVEYYILDDGLVVEKDCQNVIVI